MRGCLRQFFTHDAIVLFLRNSKWAWLMVHSGGQNGDAMRAVPAKDRVANTEHEPLAFECWSCAVLRLCIATPTGQLTRRLFYCRLLHRLLHRLLQCVFLASLGPLRFLRCIVLLHRAVHSLSVYYFSSCVVVRFIHHVLLVLWSCQFWWAMQLTQPIIISGLVLSNINDDQYFSIVNRPLWINRESTMIIVVMNHPSILLHPKQYSTTSDE